MPFSKVNTDTAHWSWTPPSLTTTIGIKPRTFCLGVRCLRFTFKSTAYFLVCFVCSSGIGQALLLWSLWRKSTNGWRKPPTEKLLTLWKAFLTTWCSCLSTPCTLKVVYVLEHMDSQRCCIPAADFPSVMHVLMHHSFLCLAGEWLTRFNPSETSKGLFYVDDQNSVSVDMMTSSKYPLRLLHDAELEATVPAFPPSLLWSAVPFNDFFCDMKFCS